MTFNGLTTVCTSLTSSAKHFEKFKVLHANFLSVSCKVSWEKMDSEMQTTILTSHKPVHQYYFELLIHFKIIH